MHMVERFGNVINVAKPLWRQRELASAPKERPDRVLDAT